jgi:hypothetical protein
MAGEPFRDLYRGKPLDLAEETIDRLLAKEFEPFVEWTIRNPDEATTNAAGHKIATRRLPFTVGRRAPGGSRTLPSP